MTSLLITMLFLPFVIKFALKIGAVDIPNARSIHTKPIARLGGLAIALGMATTVVLFTKDNFPYLPFFAGFFLMVLIGLLDDIYRLSAKWKFIFQISAATIFVYYGHFPLENLGNLFNTGDLHIQNWAIPFTVFCMVGAINAFNLSDGLDGLASGIAFIASLFLISFGWHSSNAAMMMIAASVCGAVLAFLRHNNYPARIFMGDTGSLTLGYTLAALVISGGSNTTSDVPLVTYTYLIALPLFDTLFVMSRRILKGQSPFTPDKTHLHHRLLSLGLPHPAVVVILYIITLVFGMLGMLLHEQKEYLQLAILIMAGLTIYITVPLIQRAKIKLQLDYKFLKSTLKRSKYLICTSRFLAEYSSYICGSLILIFLLPALTFDLFELNRNTAISIIGIACLLWLFHWKHDAAQRSVFHGVLYSSVFILLYIYNLSGYENQFEAQLLKYLSLATAFWVALKITIRGQHAVLFTSGFEILLLILSWFIPYVILNERVFSPMLIEAGRQSCIEALPFFLLIKIHLRRQPDSNIVVLSGLTGSLIVIALRTFII